MRDAILEVPFPFGGVVVNKAYNLQPPGTSPSALNVRGYDPAVGRDRGGQRSGLTKYMTDTVNQTFPVQDINHLTTTLAIPATSAGQFLYKPTGGTIPAAIASALGVNIANISSGTAPAMHCSCWDNMGRGFLAFAEAGGSTLTILRVNTLGVVQDTITLTSISTVKCLGMATDGVYLYVQVSSSTGGFGLPVYRFLIDGTFSQTPVGTFWYKSATTTASDALASNNMLACASGCLAIGYGNGTLEIVSTLTKAVATATVGGAGHSFYDVDTDGLNYFYAIVLRAADSNGFLAKINLLGTVAVLTNVGVNASSCCFDPVNQVVAVAFAAGGPGFSVATFNILTGATILTATPNAVQWNTIRASGTGGYVIWRNNAATNMMGLKADLTQQWAVASLSTTVTVKSVISVNNVPFVPSNLASNNTRALAVANGRISRFSSAGNITLTGGQCLSLTAPVIFSTPLFSKMYYADGMSYNYYDAATDRVQALVATAGSLPTDSYGNAGRLIETWRQRLVISGLPLDPSNWFMSAVGAPGDFNYAPSPAVETQAVAGNVTIAGLAADVINCLIPYNDEVLLIGGNQTIYQMTGDPAAGGRIDLVSETIGMAFGRPYCYDGVGVLYFMSSRGSIYRYVPGALPERISDAISEYLLGTPTNPENGQQLLQINFSASVIRMAWDERQMGFHVWITPIGGTTNPDGTVKFTLHYFYDARNEAWWIDQYHNPSHNPLAVHVLQGLQGTDRVVLLGGQDGYIRYLDIAAKDDDGTPINSLVVMGYIRDKNGFPLTITDIQCNLAETSDAVSYALAASNSPQGLNSPTVTFTGTFAARRNRSQAVRAFGHAHYVSLASNVVGKRWALEYLRVRTRTAEGKARQRIF